MRPVDDGRAIQGVGSGDAVQALSADLGAHEAQGASRAR